MSFYIYEEAIQAQDFPFAAALAIILLISIVLIVTLLNALGTSAWFTFGRVVLPTILPGILSGAFFAFMNSFDNFALSLFLSDGRSEVLPIRLWHIIEDSLDVRAAAASGLLIAATLLMERIAGVSHHLRGQRGGPNNSG